MRQISRDESRCLPPRWLVLRRVMATRPSLTKIGYRLLRPISEVSMPMHSTVSTMEMAFSRFFCISSDIFWSRSSSQSDFTTLTTTREPSHLTGTESERRIRARICDNPVGSFPSPGRTSAKVCSTKNKTVNFD